MSLRGAIEARRQMVPTFPQCGNQWEPLEAAPDKEVPTVPTVPTKNSKNQDECEKQAEGIGNQNEEKRGVARPYISVGTVGTWELSSNHAASIGSHMVPTFDSVGTSSEPTPNSHLWRYRTPDGRPGELYSPSGLTLDEARRYAPPGALDLEPATLPPESPPHFLEQTHIGPDRDDRVTCGACGNLSYGQCLAAGRGLVDAPKWYKPHLTIPRRCAAFVVKGGRVAA